MKPVPKPLIYPFENPPMTVGLGAINATEPPFRVGAPHLEAWFNEGAIARYMLLADIRKLWNLEGLGEVFDTLFGAFKGFTLIANYRADMEWRRVKAGETPPYETPGYGIWLLDTAEELYQEGLQRTPPTARNDDDKPLSRAHVALAVQVPEPVLPRYEAQKIYAMIHGLSAPGTEPKKQVTERVTAVQSKAMVELLTAHKFTADDYKGSIPALQQKLTRKGLNGTLTRVDKNTLTAWLEKAGVR